MEKLIWIKERHIRRKKNMKGRQKTDEDTKNVRERKRIGSVDNTVWKQSSKLGDVRIHATSIFFVPTDSKNNWSDVKENYTKEKNKCMRI
jgi:hypothetical protein